MKRSASDGPQVLHASANSTPEDEGGSLSVSRRRFGALFCGAAAFLSARSTQAEPYDQTPQSPVNAEKRAAESADRWLDRPVYHFHPPANWMNDPNGTIWYKGWHHLFYQMTPFSARSGVKYWGHARSKNLVDWEHLPIAIAPSTEKGELSIYSGGATLADDGKPRLVYTSIGNREPEQWMVIPTDDTLFHWEKYAQNPIVTSEIHRNGRVYGWRDPFLFQEAGRTFMVCGGNSSGEHRGGGAEVHLYEASKPDLTQWTDRGVVFAYKNMDLLDIECPNLFRLGDRWVLIISPGATCRYFVGHMDWSTYKFIPETEGALDPGSAYATNISKDDQGRTILWMWGRVANVDEGWNGVMLMPRLLSLDPEHFLRQAPPSEFNALRGAPQVLGDLKLANAKRSLPGMAGDSVEIEVEFTMGTASSVGLNLRESAAGEAGIVISFATALGMLSIGSVRVRLGSRPVLRLRIFLDRSAIEVYVEDGERAIFSTLHSDEKNVGMSAFASGGDAVLTTAKVWPMRAARFSLEHFV